MVISFYYFLSFPFLHFSLFIFCSYFNVFFLLTFLLTTFHIFCLFFIQSPTLFYQPSLSFYCFFVHKVLLFFKLIILRNSCVYPHETLFRQKRLDFRKLGALSSLHQRCIRGLVRSRNQNSRLAAHEDRKYESYSTEKS